jgi:RNA polymerase Rpc34 subunit
MYMLFHLTPSVEVTGGIWYTDNEFDTPFVKILLDHIYGYIANRVSFTIMRDYLSVTKKFTDTPVSNLVMRAAVVSTI